MLRQPIVELDARIVRHAQIGNHHAIVARGRASQLSQRYPAVLCFLGLPADPAKVSHQGRANRRLIIHYQNTTVAVDGFRCGCRMVGSLQ